ncbi:MAG: hypothetical protein ABI742_10065 [Gemmatimonadota bacterium]
MPPVQVVRALVETELARMPDALLREALRTLLVEPQLQQRDFPEGPPGARYPTWLVAQSRDFPIGLAYSELGFGPSTPWGYVSVNHLSLGDHSQWHATLDGAFKASGIWRRES